MLLGLVLVLVGIIVFVLNPLFGLVPAVILIAIGLLAMVLGGLARGASAVLRVGSMKTCPDCHSKIPSAANVCRYCGYRYG
jgi:ribosomal protein L40E